MDPSVARAVFISALLRSEAPAPDVKRDDASVFTKVLLRTLNCCTKKDVKICKTFIINTITPSRTRTAALSKYLVTVARSCVPRNSGSKVIDTTKPGDENEGLGRIIDGKVQQPPDPAFKRLHILFIVHDVLCFAATRLREASHDGMTFVDPVAIEQLKSTVPSLLQLAVCTDGRLPVSRGPKDIVISLIDIWEKPFIFTAEQLSDMRDMIEKSSTQSWVNLQDAISAQESALALEERRRREEENKWVLPRSHHLPLDPNAPWHDLPAANGLLQKRTRGYPLRVRELPPGGYALRNAGQKAPESLQREVEDLLTDAKRCFEKYTDPSAVRDIDALGNVVWKDTERKTRNYWGFSYESIEAKR